ncbi:hypothetical protein [Rhodanobacter ginsengiterrae]|uniref:hypothetical protein n=1 Tax=Rhodanobacter ginsengiterrae TaxID=2008451 RepID=UPI003CF00CF5
MATEIIELLENRRLEFSPDEIVRWRGVVCRKPAKLSVQEVEMVAGRRLLAQIGQGHRSAAKERPAAKTFLKHLPGTGHLAAELEHHGMQVEIIRRLTARGQRPLERRPALGEFTERRAQLRLFGPQLGWCIAQLREVVKAGTRSKYFTDVTQLLCQLEHQPGIIRQACLGDLQPVRRGGSRLLPPEHHLGQFHAEERLARQALDQCLERGLRRDQLFGFQVLPGATP